MSGLWRIELFDLWNLDTGRCIRVFNGHMGLVANCRLESGSANGAVGMTRC
jgi:hypothetical protein